jgi:hypothetical protein
VLAPLRGLLDSIGRILQEGQAALGGEQFVVPTIIVDVIGIGFLLAVVLLGTWLARQLLGGHRIRRRTRFAPVEGDVRDVVLPFRLPRVRARRPRVRVPFGVPADAASAYLRALGDLEPIAETRRRPEETPHAHAARLRREHRGGLALDLLAADYELARFGDVELPRREHRRAIARWRAIRASLREGPPADRL